MTTSTSSRNRPVRNQATRNNKHESNVVGKTRTATRDSKDSPAKTSRTSKFIGIASITLFIILLASAAGRFYFVHKSIQMATPEEISAAQTIVERDLVSIQLQPRDFEITVRPQIRTTRYNDQTYHLTAVLAKQGTSRIEYLVDSDTQEIVLRSMTATYGWMSVEETNKDSFSTGKRTMTPWK